MIVVAAWTWPQWIYLGLISLNLLGAAARHGRPKLQELVDFRKSMIGNLLGILLLAWGGFFA